MWACLVPPGLEPLSGRIGASYATVGDLILITVLDKATAGDRCDRSAPVACGPGACDKQQRGDAAPDEVMNP